jgi:hypothetical protein
MTSYFVNVLAIDTANPTTIYAGTGAGVNAWTTVIQQNRLTLTVVSDTANKGGGLVYNVASGISCDNTGTVPKICYFDPGTTSVTLTQSPHSDSTWATWLPVVLGCGTNENCPVPMSDNQNITVTFPYAHKARVNSNQHPCETLAEALTYVRDPDTILARDVTFGENLTISSKALTLLGGRDAWYQPLNAWTTLQGMLTIQWGSLTVDKLSIR